MKVSNKGLFLAMRWVLVLLLVLIAFDIALSLLPGSLSDVFPNHELAIISGTIILVLALFRFSFFAYEDEYEIIHIDTKSLVFAFLESPRHKHYEFAKIILADFQLEKGLFKHKLTLTVNSSTGDKKLRHFDLYFLNKEKRAYVEQSLAGVLEKNRSEAN